MISKVLVANRGEIARRIFRTCREMGIATVAVYSDPDHGEPHMREADEAVRLPGSSSAETYLNIESVVGAARATGADAIHPGYGFLAENAAFARAVMDDGLRWIGPSAEAIETMGSKLESKRLMESVGVPILGSVELSRHVDSAAAASSIGYPVLVKASAGGGGKGMRVVHRPEDLESAVESASREAASAFGDDTIFLEKYLEEPRHIEIQVFGDTHGRVLSLYERECSIQRRHQKIVEEAPSPVMVAEMREKMEAAARRAAEAVAYVGAGTVEFLYQDGAFYFLEMNTRLQVEHPVTEMITGLDLVRMQIDIADGHALPETEPPINGHAIEVRLYAEDAMNDFLPVTGEIHRFSFPSGAGLRVDSGVIDGSHVSVHYDPMIAKIIAHAPTREEAASTLAKALRKARIHTSTTNRALLVRILESKEFSSGETDTHFLQRHDAAHMARPLADSSSERRAAIASALADQAMAREDAPVLATIPSGWRNLRSQPQIRAYEGFHGRHDIGYTLDRGGFSDDRLGAVQVISATPTRVTFDNDGSEYTMEVARYGRERYVDFEETPARLVEIPRFPSSDLDQDAGSLHAPMPGKVIRVEVSEGDHVSEGDALVVMEAMKMEHTLRSPHAGIVTDVLHTDGDQVEGGAVLVIVEADARQG